MSEIIPIRLSLQGFLFEKQSRERSLKTIVLVFVKFFLNRLLPHLAYEYLRG